MTLVNKQLLERIDALHEGLRQGGLECCLERAFGHVAAFAAKQASEFDEDNRMDVSRVLANYRKADSVAQKLHNGNLDNFFILLQEVAGHVEPCQRAPRQTFAPLRQHITAIPGMGYVPPADEMRIRRDIERARRYVIENELHPVEQGAFVYFHIARIQPFEHGNKRTASVVMNAIHSHHSYAPVGFRPSEKPAFAALFKNAIQGYREDMQYVGSEDPITTVGPAQTAFFEYIAQKQCCAMRSVGKTLDCLDNYVVELDGDPDRQKMARRRVTDALSHLEGGIYKVKLRSRKHLLHVAGSISPKTLSTALDRVSGLKYEIYDARDY